MVEITPTHVFFFKDWLSNFHKAKFDMVVNVMGHLINHTFATSEQAFMYAKAAYFKDWDTGKLILEATEPWEAKRLGREVKHYDDDLWSVARFDAMYSANLHKYQENPELAKRFLDPKFDGRTFVEASPFDPIWGICLDRQKYGLEYLDDESHWKGQNLLGKVLTAVRDQLKKGSS